MDKLAAVGIQKPLRMLAAQLTVALPVSGGNINRNPRTPKSDLCRFNSQTISGRSTSGSIRGRKEA
jgi:hypothetical protein